LERIGKAFNSKTDFDNQQKDSLWSGSDYFSILGRAEQGILLSPISLSYNFQKFPSAFREKERRIRSISREFVSRAQIRRGGKGANDLGSQFRILIHWWPRSKSERILAVLLFEGEKRGGNRAHKKRIGRKTL